MKTEYVCGFLFDEDEEIVLLIRKNRPEWQAGRLNGVGGKVEPGESHLDAMIREFREEALDEDPAFEPTWEWSWFASLEGPDYVVSLWSAFTSYADVAALDGLYSDTGEKLDVVPVDALALEYHVPNLSWIIPLAIDCRRQPREVIKVVDL